MEVGLIFLVCSVCCSLVRERKCIHFHPWFWYCCSSSTTPSIGNYNDEKKHLPVTWIILLRLDKFCIKHNASFNPEVLFKRAFYTFYTFMILEAEYFHYYFVSYQRTFLVANHHSMPILFLEFLNKPAHWYTDLQLQDAGKIGCGTGHMLQSWFFKDRHPQR